VSTDAARSVPAATASQSAGPAPALGPVAADRDGRVGGWTRGILWANLVAQIAIVVTGGLVRLTGSGLGCPTWPECTDGNLVPVPGQPQGFHTFIEFGNRTLTGVLVVVAVGALLAVSRGWWGRWVGRPGPAVRRPLVVLASLVVAGIVGQAVLGGVTVLVGLNPAFVAAHLLLSMAVIAAAFVLLVRSGEPHDGPATVVVRPQLRVLAQVLVGLAFVVLVLGTVVTGSGPHSGDASDVTRLPLDPRVVSWLHADVVIAFVGLAVAFWLGARLTDAPAGTVRRALLLIGACVLQGAIGYTQYFTALPVGLVTLHMLGACLVWVATLAVLAGTRARGLVGAP
jgi:cytochrome c oxidase assembly protein subunit 15